MVRAPCCEKMGMKKGPWTPEEDQILINYIRLYGHGNWRALPKQAGLLRCGKSCRLRWTNYLRPDIKRGNFSREEEETIIKLHEMLGNRWSAIAARLPGRTDNEIKNVWHTHLKKRLKQISGNSPITMPDFIRASEHTLYPKIEPEPISFPPQFRPNSPQVSNSDLSSASTDPNNNNNNESTKIASSSSGDLMADDFWSEVLSLNNSGGVASGFPGMGSDPMESAQGLSSNVYDSVEFWQSLFTRAGELPELLEI